MIDEVANDYAGKALVGKLNVDENRDTAIEYGVMSIPTLLVFKSGEIVDRVVGYKPKEELVKVLNRVVE